MSERITKSMYDNFPFEKWKEIGHKNAALAKIDDIRRRARYKLLMRQLNRDSIADVKVDFSEMKRFAAEEFPESGPKPWLDRDDADQKIDALLKQGSITAERAEQARYFSEHGYLILNGFYTEALVDEVWNDYVKRVYEGKVPVETYQKDHGDLFLGRCLNPHFAAPKLKKMTQDARLLDLLNFLLGVEAIPYQTIVGFAGSEQKAHSDSIHMSTYPVGYLIAVWTAFEDIHADSGPLEYYPGSHKLPYVFSHDASHQPRDLQHKRTSWYNEVYEDDIEHIVDTNGLEKKFLTCKKGDALIWHANLIHGGSPRLDKQLSRKALVGHYFGKGAFCYGDRNEIFADPYQGK